VRAENDERQNSDAFEADGPLPPIALQLSTRYAIEGSVLGNVLRQVDAKAGAYEGTLEPIISKQVAAFQSNAGLGRAYSIVPRKTSADLGDEPVLLVPAADSADAT
jgi:hypothetical protein